MTFLIRPGFFRLLLALAVVASHLSNYEIGRPAVFAFFALSGFWVMRMYDERYRHAPGVAVFYVSRVLRIWLPFAVAYLTVLAVTPLVTGAFDAQHFASLVILGIASGERDVLGVSWSLDIELQFYLLVPLLWLVLHGEQGRERVRMLALGVLSVPAAIFGWWLQLRFGIWTVLSYLPAFAAGIAIWHSGWRPGLQVALASVTAFLLLAALTWMLPETRAFLLKDVPTVIHEDWFGMTWVALLLPFIAFNVRQPSSRLDQHFGNFSYALYITHWPVIWLVKHWLGAPSLAEKLAMITVVAVVAVAFYLAVDRPAERLRQRIVTGMLRHRAVLRPS